MGMKAKTIRGAMRRKINDWVDSIQDDQVKQLVKNNTIVTGGSIASMLLGEKVNDYDVYFRDRETTLAVAEYYIKQFNANASTSFKDASKVVSISLDDTQSDRVSIKVQSAGIAFEEDNDQYQYFEGVADPDAAADYVEEVMEQGVPDTIEDSKPKYRPVFLSTNAITLSDKVQIVLRFYGEPDELHENYDFVHCMNYWDHGKSELVLKPEALECLLARELRYIGSKYPVCSVIRTRKFIQRGWKINAGQYLKMAMQISELDLHDIRVLQDQLTGVDVAYFQEVIDKLKVKNNEKVDSTYLMEIINRMF